MTAALLATIIPIVVAMVTMMVMMPAHIGLLTKTFPTNHEGGADAVFVNLSGPSPPPPPD